jgi:hypothetical protein
MPLWKAVLIDYIHTLAICGIMMKKLLRRFVVEDCPVSIWLILIRLLNSTLFSMSNLPIITRALFILSIPMSVPYFIQLIATYTTYTVLVAVLFHWQILYKDTAINMMACQTAASFYILLSLFYVLRKAIRFVWICAGRKKKHDCVSATLTKNQLTKRRHTNHLL